MTSEHIEADVTFSRKDHNLIYLYDETDCKKFYRRLTVSTPESVIARWLNECLKQPGNDISGLDECSEEPPPPTSKFPPADFDPLRAVPAATFEKINTAIFLQQGNRLEESGITFIPILPNEIACIDRMCDAHGYRERNVNVTIDNLGRITMKGELHWVHKQPILASNSCQVKWPNDSHIFQLIKFNLKQSIRLENGVKKPFSSTNLQAVWWISHQAQGQIADRFLILVRKI